MDGFELFYLRLGFKPNSAKPNSAKLNSDKNQAGKKQQLCKKIKAGFANFTLKVDIDAINNITELSISVTYDRYKDIDFYPVIKEDSSYVRDSVKKMLSKTVNNDGQYSLGLISMDILRHRAILASGAFFIKLKTKHRIWSPNEDLIRNLINEIAVHSFIQGKCIDFLEMDIKLLIHSHDGYEVVQIHIDPNVPHFELQTEAKHEMQSAFTSYDIKGYSKRSNRNEVTVKELVSYLVDCSD